MQKLNNKAYIDTKNKVIAIDAPTEEEARRIALEYLEQLGIENEYDKMYNALGIPHEKLLTLDIPKEDTRHYLEEDDGSDLAEVVAEDYTANLLENGIIPPWLMAPEMA